MTSVTLPWCPAGAALPGGLPRDSVDLDLVARRVVERHRAAPCAVVGAALRAEGGWRYGWGAAGRLEHAVGAPPATLQTLFDWASLTKPLTALALARLERAGLLGRDEPLGATLSELRRTPSAEASWDQLAAHRAGLLAHVELFVPARGARQLGRREILEQAASARRPSCGGPLPPEGFAPTYSDLGYILLGAGLAERAGLPTDAVVAREVAAPLGLRFGSARQLALGAPDVDTYLCAVAPTERVPWRGGLVHGVVHDENAWVLAGAGMAGHAGAFGDAASLVQLGVAIVDALDGRRAEWLTAAELRPLVEPRSGGGHAGGFDLRSGDRPSSGRHFGPRTFGHLGFTGTSLWIDPDRRLVGALLSNRVHPSRRCETIRLARPDAYDGIYQAMVR